MKTWNVWKDESGQTLVVTVLCMTVTLGLVALATDVGQMFHTKEQAQTAADAAVIAAVQQQDYGDPVAAADEDAAKNGFPNGVNGNTVKVEDPPGTGSLAGQDGYIEVIVSRQTPTYFMRLFGVNDLTVAAKAVATLGPATDCVYTLDSSGTDINVAGSADVQSTCGFYGNSSSSSDLTVGGGGILDSTNENLVGGYSLDNNGTLTVPPTTGIMPVPDPLGGIQPPQWSASNCLADPKLTNSPPGTSIGPAAGGTVCYDGLTLNGGSVTLNPGIYVINGAMKLGGNVTVDGTVNGTVNGASGVTFYITQNGSLNIESGAIVNLVAPDSGTYNGILFYQDPSNTTTASIEGGAGSTLDGILYFPAALLQLDGGTSTDTYISIVAGQVTLGGNLSLKNYGKLNPTSPLSSPRLED